MKTLIKLGRCQGWSESSLGTQIILFVLSCSSSYAFKDFHREEILSVTCFDHGCVSWACWLKSMQHKQAHHLGRAKRIWYLSHMRAAKVQASLRIRAVSPEPPLLAHTSSESRGTFRQKARSLAPLNGWACAVKICHDGMLEDTNSLGGAHLIPFK